MPAIQPIQMQRKIRNPKMISTINKLSVKWGLSQQDVIYKILNEAVIKEADRMDKIFITEKD